MSTFIAINVFLFPVICVLFGVALGVCWCTSTPEKENRQSKKSVNLPPFKR